MYPWTIQADAVIKVSWSQSSAFPRGVSCIPLWCFKLTMSGTSGANSLSSQAFVSRIILFLIMGIRKVTISMTLVVMYSKWVPPYPFFKLLSFPPWKNGLSLLAPSTLPQPAPIFSPNIPFTSGDISSP